MKFLNNKLNTQGMAWLAEMHAKQAQEYEARTARFALLKRQGRELEAQQAFDELVDFVDRKLMKTLLALKTGELFWG